MVWYGVEDVVWAGRIGFMAWACLAGELLGVFIFCSLLPKVYIYHERRLKGDALKGGVFDRGNLARGVCLLFKLERYL